MITVRSVIGIASEYDELVVVSGLGKHEENIKWLRPYKPLTVCHSVQKMRDRYHSRFPVLIISAQHDISGGTIPTVGFAGQQPPLLATLPNAAACFQPAQLDWQVTVSYEIFQTPKS